MKTVYYVVLHYQDYKSTISCVESILSLKGKNYVIIVDNGSPNCSGKKLKKYFENFDSVYTILSDINYGFAKGNNIGFKFAKDKGAEYIVLVNNDVKFTDVDFSTKLIDLYNQTSYAVLGPNIINLNKESTSPIKGFKINTFTLLGKIIKNLLGYLLSYVKCDTLIKKKKKYVFSSSDECKIVPLTHSSLVLQGSCLIFSEKYISVFDGLYDKTFMYYEEYILKYLCEKHKMKMVYSSMLEVTHIGKVSTRKSIGSELASRRFKYINSIKSLFVFIELYWSKDV